MLFKYFVKFDEEGEIACFCKNKPLDCSETCTEYIVKLIQIERASSQTGSNLTKSVNNLGNEADKLTSEIKKVRNKLRRSFK